MFDHMDQEERLFRKTLKASLAFYFLLGLMLTVARLPELKTPDVRHLSKRAAKLILEPPKIPKTKPEPPKAKNRVRPEPAGKSQPKKEAVAKAKPQPKKKVATKKKAPRPSAAQNREIVRKSGLLASFIEEEAGGALNDVMEDKELERALSEVNVISAKPEKKRKKSSLRTMSRPNKSKLADAKIAKIANLQKGEGVALAKREAVTVTRITSEGGGADGRGHGLGRGVGLQVKGAGAERAAIDYDAISRVVDKYKGGLVYLYNKALRKNPTLKGTVTVEFSIDENGKVVEARVVNSTMAHPRLEKALAKRIKMWKFPKLYHGLIVLTYPFVFFPV